MINRIIRIYTPFICSLFVLLNGVCFILELDNLDFVYALASISGSSILLVIYMYSVSRRMCIWYKLNLLTLLLTQVIGLMYDIMSIDVAIYLYSVTCLSILGIIFFLIYKVFYKTSYKEE